MDEVVQAFSKRSRVTVRDPLPDKSSRIRTKMSAVLRPAALSDQVVATLEERILRGNILPGAALPSERELCAEFAVSRTVLREALARLRGDGYLESRQGAGTIVSAHPGRLSYRLPTSAAIGREDLKSIMELRVAVEVAAAELAAKRRLTADLKAMRTALNSMDDAVRDCTDGSEADDQFHYAIAAASQNPHLKRFVEFLRHQFGATRRPTWSEEVHHSGIPRKAQEEHIQLYRAISAKSPEAASQFARAHLVSSAKRIGLTNFVYRLN